MKGGTLSSKPGMLFKCFDSMHGASRVLQESIRREQTLESDGYDENISNASV